jgi:hypothetical protein
VIKKNQLIDVLNEEGIQLIKDVPFPITEKRSASDSLKEWLKTKLDSFRSKAPGFSTHKDLIYPLVNGQRMLESSRLGEPPMNIVNFNALLVHMSILPRRLSRLDNLGLNHFIFLKPYLAVFEARKDDFNNAWCECFYCMLSKKRDEEEYKKEDKNMPIYGVTTNGLIWQFAKLEGREFIQYSTRFTTEDLDTLLSGLRTLFELSRLNIRW